MKKSILPLLFILFSFSVSAQSIKNQKAVIKTNIYCEHCQECQTCGKVFKTNMLKIKGVKMYQLDDKNMTITVYYNGEKTNLETIRTSISKFGYDADELKADPAAYNKFDDCCKKA